MGARSLLVIGGIATATLLYLIYLALTLEAPQGTTTIVVPPPANDLQPPTNDLQPPANDLQPPANDLQPPANDLQPPANVAEPTAVQPIQRDPEPVEADDPPEVLEVEPPPIPVTEPAPVEPDPIPVEVVEEPVIEEPPIEVVELPSLNNSDSFVVMRLRQLQSGAELLGYLADEQLVRRFVVMVDNISNGTLPQSNLPYRGVPDEMPVRSVEENLFVMEESGFQRFDQAFDALVAIDSGQAMSLYQLFSPLFQQAYTELGYRDVNFDNVLRQAIRKVLSTDEIEGPLQLIKPSVMYLYADTNIEGMEDIQKQMIRIGPDNAEKLKTKLRQILQQL